MRNEAPPAALLLTQAERRFIERAQSLGTRLDAGDEAAWPDYIAVVVAMKQLVGVEREPLMTTKTMAEKLGVTPKTVRRLGKAGKLEAVRLGKRGTGAIRWRA
jgi:excisionase family DNA binding protein